MGKVYNMFDLSARLWAVNECCCCFDVVCLQRLLFGDACVFCLESNVSFWFLHWWFGSSIFSSPSNLFFCWE